MFALFHPDGIMSADGDISPEFYTDFQDGEPGQTGYMSRYGALRSPKLEPGLGFNSTLPNLNQNHFLIPHRLARTS